MFRFRNKKNITVPEIQINDLEFLDRAYERVGLNYVGSYKSERFFIENVLPLLIPQDAVCVDVGANVGTYSYILRNNFPSVNLYCFEPNPYAREKLSKVIVPKLTHIEESALGAEFGDGYLHVENDELHTGLASLHRNVFEKIHHTANIKEINVKIDTLDSYVQKNNISKIDFIKIDVEGNELAVLKGARALVSSGKLPLVQFEFNEMNIISGTFLKDFYDTLPGYSFYRLQNTKLVPLGDYSTHNEIFMYQNILAVGNEADKEIIKKYI